MKKEKYPILEFDETPIAKINPDILKLKYPQLPKKLIITFFKDVIDKLLDDGLISKLFTISGENDFIVYKFIDLDVCVVHGIIGGPACGGYYDALIALGVENTMFCGGGGALNYDLKVGKLIVVKSAIRDDGMSYHYLAPSREVESNEYIRNKICECLNERKIEFIVGKVWTTDAFYRETENKIKIRIEEGALLVEMEQASLIAISQFRKVNYGAILYAGDSLAGPVWESRGWHSRSEVRMSLFNICLEILEKI